MGWTVEVDASAEKSLAKLGTAAGRRIVKGLREIATLDDPKTRGKALTGPWAGHWRYRFGDYRVIAQIVEQRLVIVVIAVGHRREVYD